MEKVKKSVNNTTLICVLPAWIRSVYFDMLSGRVSFMLPSRHHRARVSQKRCADAGIGPNIFLAVFLAFFSWEFLSNNIVLVRALRIKSSISDHN